MVRSASTAILLVTRLTNTDSNCGSHRFRKRYLVAFWHLAVYAPRVESRLRSIVFVAFAVCFRLSASALSVAIFVAALAPTEAVAAPAVDLTVIAQSGENSGGAFPVTNVIVGADGNYYGVTDKGGRFGSGIAFRLTPNGDFKVLATFNGKENGGEPRGRLLQATDGNFYGTTYNPGMVYRLTPGGTLTTLVRFADGVRCQTGLIQATDGNFYGTDNTSVFKLAPDGQLTVLGRFPNVIPPQPPRAGIILGAQPSELVQASDGNLYGRTITEFFRVSLSGEVTVLSTFAQTQSLVAMGPLVEGLDGKLYGISPQRTTPGEQSTTPVIQQITVSGSVAIFASFDYSTSGFPESARLLHAQDGSFYGTTLFGGANSLGSVFRVSGSGISTIASFNGNNGRGPVDGLILAPNGKFRGATSGAFLAASGFSSGPGTFGTLYEVTPLGQITTLHTFERTLGVLNSNGYRSFPAPDGSSVFGSFNAIGHRMFEAPDGSWYGSDLSLHDRLASVFRIGPDRILQFVATDPTPGNSISTFVPGNDGTYYATTEFGGAAGKGSIVRLTLPGALETLFSFAGGNGSGPRAALLPQPDGSFYGTTFAGGQSNLGTVFRFAPGGGVQTLVNFDGSNGANPVAEVMRAGDGNLYGTTSEVAPNYGTVFRISREGTFSTLVQFTGTNGRDPEAALYQASDGLLYGTTVFGGKGPSSSGTVFRIDRAGNFTQVADVPSGTANPFSTLIETRDGSLYGTASRGPALHGSIFRASKSGTGSRIYAFNGNDGQSPTSGPVRGSDGAYYGLTENTAYRFVVLPPQITTALPAGTRLEIGGQNLSEATIVTVGGIAAASFVVNSPTRISAVFDSAVPEGDISVTTPLGTGTFTRTPVEPGPLLNISTRGFVGKDNDVLIGGFIVQGTGSKKVIIRALGPSVIPTCFTCIPSSLQDPVLELHDSKGTVTFNDNWKDSQQEAISATGIPPSDDRESAIVAILEPGEYTAVMRASISSFYKTGIGLIEVYDLDQGASARLANISTRGLVQTGDNVMIGGFIIGGSQPATVVVRALGPSVPIPSTLMDPVLELHDENGNVFSNDNWRSDQKAEIIATTLQPARDEESTIVAALAPGSYTAIVRGVNASTGVALVEVYKLN